jgi:hypothetical protein
MSCPWCHAWSSCPQCPVQVKLSRWCHTNLSRTMRTGCPVKEERSKGSNLFRLTCLGCPVTVVRSKIQCPTRLSLVSCLRPIPAVLSCYHIRCLPFHLFCHGRIISTVLMAVLSLLSSQAVLFLLSCPGSPVPAVLS